MTPQSLATVCMAWDPRAAAAATASAVRPAQRRQRYQARMQVAMLLAYFRPQHSPHNEQEACLCLTYPLLCSWVGSPAGSYLGAGLLHRLVCILPLSERSGLLDCNTRGRRRRRHELGAQVPAREAVQPRQHREACQRQCFLIDIGVARELPPELLVVRPKVQEYAVCRQAASKGIL